MSEFTRDRVKGFLHADGRRMVNGDGEEVILRGWSMGNWSNPEGWMVGGTPMFMVGLDSHKLPRRYEHGRSIEQCIRELCGSEYAKNYWSRWTRAFLAEEDIAYMAEQGMNSIRLPMSARLFLDEEPGIHFNEDSFAMLDEVLDLCEKYRLYAILDMHAAVGGQSGLLCDDGLDNIPRMFLEEESRERTMLLWEEFARRYKDRWIVGAYELLNEPISPPRFTHLVPELIRFYDEVIARIRKIDKNHMFSLEGHRFSSRVDIFTGDHEFDPGYHNWHIHTHYVHDPQMKSLEPMLQKSEECNVPLWSGENNDTNEGMAVFYEMLTTNHSGFNIWSYKIAENCQVTHAVTYPLPKDWDKVYGYIAEGGPRPSYEESQRIFDEMLENVKFCHCTKDEEVHHYLLRRAPFAIPATGYDAMPGRGISFGGSQSRENIFGYRLGDGMPIVGDPGYVPAEDAHFAMMSGKQPEREWEHLCLRVTPGVFASYTVHEVQPGTTGKLTALSGSDGVIRVSIPGMEDVRLTLKEGESEPFPIPEGEKVTVRLECVSGSVLLKTVAFVR
ncbi:MAG: cellulase family glycosylhydrolase [Candidatus Heritagella sp.]|nr:cellulase family glycosylhydrolase [Candidatus Heritagella sp.]